MLGEERRQYIINLVDKTGGINASEIAKILNLSEVTIRRDLNKLAKKGLVTRTHGGAINASSVGHELRFDVQKDKNIDEKKKIALAASALVDEGDVILLEAGTTGYYMAMDVTSRKELTVITNSCDIAVLLGKTNPNFKIILSGGILNTDTHSLVGPIADSALRSLFVDKAFIGITGIEISKGITAVDQLEAQTKKYILNNAKKIIALCDYTKIGHVSMNFVSPVKIINTFITDSHADTRFLEKLREIGIEIIES
jgi:DeoR family transcriptional regulator, fructose operon transcriptional repressor